MNGEIQRMTLWSKVKFVLMAGVGLYSDGYLNIVIGLGESIRFLIPSPRAEVRQWSLWWASSIGLTDLYLLPKALR